MLSVGKLASIASAAIAILLIACPPARAQAPDPLDILAGKTVRVIITGTPGQGTDSYARTLVDGLSGILPQTNFIAQNVTGGAGSNAFIEAVTARGDAIALVATHTSPVYSQMLGSDLSRPFDLTEFHWIGALTNNQRIVVARTSLGVDTFDELVALSRRLVTPVELNGSIADIEAKLVTAITALELNLIAGVEAGLRDSLLLSGDADLAFNNHYAMKPMLDSGDLVPILRLAEDGYPADLDDVPTLPEVAPPGTPVSLFETLDTLNKLGRMILAAPRTDPAIVAALRLAFDRAVATPDLAATYAAGGMLLVPTGGAELEQRITALLANAEGNAILKAYLECGTREAEGVAVCEPR